MPAAEAAKLTVTIYRGCPSERVRGISWTTSLTVAEGFARGHRAIPVPNPVIVSAKVPSEAILAVFVDRNESEVIVDPDTLVDLSVVDYVLRNGINLIG